MTALTRRIPLAAWRRRLRGCVVPAALVAAWQFASHGDAAHQYAFVPLQQVGSALLELARSGELATDLGASLRRTTLGLGVGIAAGLALGAAMARSTLVRKLCEPAFQALRYVPLLGLIPLLSLWAGTGEFAKIFIVALAAFYPMTTASFDGLSRVDPRYVELAQSYRLTRVGLWRDVLLPGALPDLFTGVLQAVPFAWITATSSELLFNAGAGVGNLMQNAQAGARADVLLVCVLGVTALAAGMSLLCERIAQRAMRWRDHA
ncbi:ABC transporter permease [Burkholderia pseudomultivorans]|uniref:ABC transporter permease n=1 Tax=Burkholderia pseudomultivorans TaxID=1207504 RepID=UPI0008420143|nr:ABC transporter permease [Burkholderia pseudomultivorans]AOI89306.1 ABC transporter permease [Burkholderia pseudomultivorans]MDS0793069.1 ABC transporter permease [Burkholderia pseudomultivorans]